MIRTVTASAQIPQYTLQVDVAAAPLQAARQALREAGQDVSVADLLHAATAKSLAENPLLNASFTETETVINRVVNLAFIVEVNDGMLTPVIHGAQQLSVPELASARRQLTERAVAGKIAVEELEGGTFTVSNLGPLGVDRFAAMVLPPQVGILAVGTARRDGQMALTLTVDHRVVDGAAAARFLQDVRHRLELPVAAADGRATLAATVGATA